MAQLLNRRRTMPTTRAAAALALFALWGCERSKPPSHQSTPLDRPAMSKAVAVFPVVPRAAAANGEPLKRLAAGAALEVWRDDRDPAGVLRLSSGGFVEAREIFPLPLAPKPRFVVDPEATLFADAERKQPGRRLKLGEALAVLQSDAWPEVAAVVKSGALAGFVTSGNLGDAAPTAASLVERALVRMRQLDAPGTARLVGGALALEPKHPVASAIYGAMFASTPQGWAILKQAPRSPPLPELALDPPPGEGPAWVLASLLRLRAKPDEKAKSVRELPIGTELVLEGAAPAGWARARVARDRTFAAIAARSGEGLSLGEGRLAPTDPAAGDTVGFVPRVFLSGEAPTGAVLETHFQGAHQKPDHAVVWAQRLAALAPSRERHQALVGLALETRRYELAGRALVEATRPAAAERPDSQSGVELEYLWGCSADPREARPERVEAGQTPTAACIDFVEFRPCDACSPHEDHPEEPLTEEQLAEQARAHAAEEAEARAAQQAWDDRMKALRAKYPKGAWLRVRAELQAAPDAQQLFVAVTRFDPSVVAPGGDELLEVLEVPLPNTNLAPLVDVYVPARPDQAIRYDAFFAPDLETARRRANPAAEEEPLSKTAAASWTRAAPGCDCGC